MLDVGSCLTYVEKPRVSCREDEFGSEYITGLCDLIRMLPPGIEMAEVGCLAGEATVYFAQRARLVHAIDPWDLWIDKWPTGTPMAEIEQIFRERTKDKNIIVHKGFSTEIAATFEKASLDFVYIDAIHSYLPCLEDIQAWWPKLKPGSFLGGHDYSPLFPGVRKAVDECFRNVLTFKDTSWLVQLD